MRSNGTAPYCLSEVLNSTQTTNTKDFFTNILTGTNINWYEQSFFGQQVGIGLKITGVTLIRPTDMYRMYARAVQGSHVLDSEHQNLERDDRARRNAELLSGNRYRMAW